MWEGVPLGQQVPEGSEGRGKVSLDRLEQRLERWDQLLAGWQQLDQVTGVVTCQLHMGNRSDEMNVMWLHIIHNTL